MEPFKNYFNPAMMREMAQYFQRENSKFDVEGFVAFCVEGIEERELKQRSNRIVAGLEIFLPEDFVAATDMIVASLDPQVEIAISSNPKQEATTGIRGWAIMPMADYVALRGQENIVLSLDVLKQLTMRWSAEFAVRPFLEKHPETVLSILDGWTADDNSHVRRLVSEGTRPLLPWGMRLYQFVENPAPVLELLEKLKDDESEYVRRSVANNLNDVSKHHPDLIAMLALRWMRDASDTRQRLVRHALRSLIKQGHKGALKALGYGPPQVELIAFKINTPVVQLGESLEIDIEIASNGSENQPFIVDFAVHHCLANGKTSPKVFKWKNFSLAPKQIIQLSKRHLIKPITTRNYYAGQHRVEILLNGVIICHGNFDLVV